MSVNLQKGQKINLSKQGYDLRRVMVGLGWDEIERKKGFFSHKPQDIDCDAFAVLLGYDGKLLYHTTNIKECTVFFNNLSLPNGSIRHMGDNLTGAGEGDDEQIYVELDNVPYDIGSIVFAVNIYEAYKRKQHFGMIKNAFIRVVDVDRNTELCRFNLSDNYDNMTALVAGGLIKTNQGWEFIADGNAARVESLTEIVSMFI